MEHGFEITDNKTHQLKILPEYFKVVQEGIKTFELRKNDRGFKVEDRLILQEYREYESHMFDEMCEEYGGEITKEISYILEGVQYGLEEGYCILGLKDIEDKECPYCIGDVDKRKYLLTNCEYEVYIDGNNNLTGDDNLDFEDKKLNYCPICGRRLT